MKAKYFGFNWRSFLSVYMGFSFLIMTVTGIILYIAPPGRVAHWSNWTLAGLLKEEWQAIHTIFTFIFIAAGVLHIIFNWKPLLSYLRKKAEDNSKIKKETVMAALFSLLILVGTLFAIPPFGTVMDVGEYFTESWSTEEVEPPVPHAERMTIEEFAATIKMEKEEFIAVLKRSGLVVKEYSTTIQELADQYSIAPSKIFAIVKSPNSEKSESSLPKMGSGFGRKMLSEVLNDYNLSWDNGIELLGKKNIVVESDCKIKDLAEENNVTPIEVVKILVEIKE